MSRSFARASGCLLWLVAALVTAQCGGDDGDPGAGAPTATATKDGLAMHDVSSAGFTIGVPESWRAFSVDDAFNKDRFDDLVEENPQFAPYAEAFADPDSFYKFFAADRDVKDGFATNVNVVVVPAPGVGWEEFARANLTEIRRVATRGEPVEHEELEIGGLRAQRVIYAATFNVKGERLALAGVQFQILGNDRGYFITYTTTAEQKDDYADDFEKSAQSFRATD